MSSGPVNSGPDAGRVVSVIVPADLLTPVGAFLRLAPPGTTNCFLLESVEGGAARGRYSVIGLDPDLLWRCRDGVAETGRRDGAGVWRFVSEQTPALDSLRATIAANRLELAPGLPPMTGALVGYLGYDMVRLMERLPRHGLDDLALPEALLIRPRLFAIFDNVRDELTLAAPVREVGTVAEAEVRVAAAVARLGQSLPPEPVARAAHAATIEPQSNCTREKFLGMVERCREFIAAGDVFQVVPSQRFSAPFAAPAITLYRALRRINPAPFLYVLELADDAQRFAIVGSSPEILVRVRDGVVTIRPLAGTRRRGVDAAEDLALERSLLADPKERAEHLMLVDLGRNDVGRVSALGSVRVTESFVVERFSHVMHLSSNVEGRLRRGSDAVDALCAGFPAGTLSGAPKIRAMEVIEELEPTRRGIYGGCIGYFAADGTMDTCIGLRTALLKDGVMHVQAGAGVVADSIAENEWEETRQKARALFRAAEEARRFS